MPRTVAERADVIPALAEVFREYGYEGATLALLSQRSGLGRSSLYHFFPGGKKEMGEAVLDHIHTWFEIHVFEPLGGEASPVDLLEYMFEAVTRYFHSGQRVCIVGVFALTETRDRFAEQVNHYFVRWRDQLALVLQRAGLQKVVATDFAEDVVLRIQGALILARAQSESAVFMRALKRLHGELTLALDPAARTPSPDRPAWDGERLIDSARR